MPAAAVIPAPIAYIKVVAVKKLVVESVFHAAGSSFAVLLACSWNVLSVDFSAVVCVLHFKFSAKIFLMSITCIIHGPILILPRCSSLSVVVGRHVYFEQIRVLKAG